MEENNSKNYNDNNNYNNNNSYNQNNNNAISRTITKIESIPEREEEVACDVAELLLGEHIADLVKTVMGL